MITVCRDVQLCSAYVLWHYAVVLHKELAFGKRSYTVSEDYSTVHSLTQAILGKCKSVDTVVQFPVVTHCTAVEYHESEFLPCWECIADAYANVAVIFAYSHHNTSLFNLRQLKLMLLHLSLAILHCDLSMVLYIGFRGEDERTLSHMFRGCLQNRSLLLENCNILLSE